MEKIKEAKKEIYIIIFAFLFLAISVIVLRAFSLYDINTMKRVTSAIYEHPLKVSNAALLLQLDVYKIHEDTKDIVFMSSQDELIYLLKDIDEHKKSAYENLKIIKENILGEEGLKLQEQTQKIFNELQESSDEIASLAKNAKIDESIAIIKDKNEKQILKLENSVNNIYMYAKNKAFNFKNESDFTFEKLEAVTVLAIILFLLLFGVIAYYTINRISNYMYKNEHLRGVLSVIRDVNQLIVREKNREKLIQECCDILASKHVFHNACMILYDSSKQSEYIVSSDKTEDFILFQDKIKNGWTPHCIAKTVQKGNTFSFIENPKEYCEGCPLKDTYNEKSAFDIELKYENKNFGYLTLRIDKEFFNYSDELLLLEEVAGDIAYALNNIEIEKNILDLKELYDNTINSLENLLFVKDRNFSYITCNRAFERFIGKSKNEIIGKSDYDILDKESADFFRRHDEAIFADKTPKLNYEWVTYPDGKKVYLLTTKSPLLSHNEEIIGLVGNSVDVTKQKESEEALIESQKRFKQLMKESPSVIEVYDLDGFQIDVNHAYEVLWGFPASLTLHKFNLFKSKEVETTGLLEYIKRAYAGESVSVPLYEFDSTGDTEAAGKGRVRILNTRIYPLKDSQGGVENIVITHEDVTQREKSLLELEQKNKIMIAQSRHAAMGEMIGMIAHQWRQPISIVSMIANNILLDAALGSFDASKIETYSKDILEQTEHLSKTIDDFRNFFKPDKSVSKIKMKDVIDETLSIVKDSLKNNSIKINTHYQSQTQINGYPRELMQVFVNIINNAKDALIYKKVNDASIEISVYDDEEHVNTKICNNGGNIQKDIISKIFDPYFTTKDEKTGTGLGLYMSKMIVEEHLYGIIEVLNIKNGVCFIVRLPKEKGI